MRERELCPMSVKHIVPDVQIPRECIGVETMTKITCPCVECVHNGKRYKCTADKIKLTWRNVATVNEGRVDMWVCNHYEIAEWVKELDKKFEQHLRGE